MFDVSQWNMIKFKGLMLHFRHVGHSRDMQTHLCHYFLQTFAEVIKLKTAGPPGAQAVGTDLRAGVVAHRH